MRSFVALMTCIGCIAWIHSCEKRLLGVRVENNSIIPNYQLPVAVVPPSLPAHYISRSMDNTSRPTPLVRTRNRNRVKKQATTADYKADALLFNLASVKGQSPIYSNINP
jgi:transcription initiation factor TFIID subunit TAF12